MDQKRGAVARGLAFEEARHRYTLDGVTVPSVTQVLDPYSGLEHVPPDVLERAKEFGTHVHQAVHLFNEERLDFATLDRALLPFVQGWQKFLDETGAVVLDSERRVASRRHGYAGTLDVRVYWGRSIRLIDVKSSAIRPRTVGPQTAAYSEALREETGERVRDRYCVRLTQDARYIPDRLDDPRDWEMFKAALVVRRWCEDNNRLSTN